MLVYNTCIIDCNIRLVGGSNIYEGRVEVCFDNQWGTVCDDHWDTADAQVVCRQLGYSTYNVAAFHNAYFGQGNGSIYINNVTCHSTEYSLFSCNYTSSHNCSHYEDAGVRCGGKFHDCIIIKYNYIGCIVGDIRLVGGSDRYEGRVEVCFNNTWGTVCDDAWDDFDAQVVCRQLGYSIYNAVAYRSAYFGQGNGSIHLNHVVCVGRESSLSKCNSARDNLNCRHSEDAGVKCGTGKQKYSLTICIQI